MKAWIHPSLVSTDKAAGGGEGGIGGMVWRTFSWYTLRPLVPIKIV